ncbi:hypothetical protein MUN81_02865 [Hymenobacter sp. 5317J-9]|uniref:hypothetical protein n=1 Tax=Hymenobacter sp. 5317J-9 TaxID=2932250 RepID=UPI001FD71E75|nr:hypothetical protein [Hymenobacter sp. 5317J-9]UOQ98436.1 hypothetical protein MUN81_02865 [Hymenobacter sp. 5317J-9]
MSNFSASLRRHSVTIGVSFALCLGVAYYLLVQVPSRQSKLQARYFQALERIGQNMAEQHTVFEKRSESMLREIVNGLVPSTMGPVQLREFASVFRKKELKNSFGQTGAVEQNLPRFDSVQLLPQHQVVKAITWNSQTQQFSFAYRSALLDTIPGARMEAEGQQIVVRTSVTSKEFIQNLGRLEVFDVFFVVGPGGDGAGNQGQLFNEVYYSSPKGPPMLDLTGWAKGKMPHWLRDTSGLQATRQAAVSLGGQSYQVFIQPVQLRPGTTWLLCGAIATERFAKEKQELPTPGIELALLLVVLGVLALPLLRVLLMTAHERLNLRDVVFCGLSLVVGLMLVILLLLSPTARYNIAPDSLDIQLQLLARQVDDAVQVEMNALRQQLTQATQANKVVAKLVKEANSRAAQEAGNVGPTNLRQFDYRIPSLPWQAVVDTLPRPAARCPWLPEQLQWLASPWQADADSRPWLVDAHVPPRPAVRRARLTDQMLWLDSHGVALLSRDFAGDSGYYQPDLRERGYFKAWQRNLAGYRPPAALVQPRAQLMNQARLSSVRRYGRFGEKGVVLTMPGWLWADSSRPQPILGLYVTRLTALTKPILPPEFSFCVVNTAGEVQFHSDDRLSLSENVLQDCEPSGLIKAALLSQEPAQASIHYQGHRYRMRVGPMKSVQGYFLLTLASEEELQSRQLRTLVLATFLLVGVAGTTLGLLALLQMAQTRRGRRMPARNTFPRLWPQARHLRHYVQIILAGMVGLVLQFLAVCCTTELAHLFLLVLLPAWLVGFASHYLQLASDDEARIRWLMQVVLVSVVALINLLAGFSMGWLSCDFWSIIAFQAVLAVVFGIMWWAETNRTSSLLHRQASPAPASPWTPVPSGGRRTRMQRLRMELVGYASLVRSGFQNTTAAIKKMGIVRALSRGVAWLQFAVLTLAKRLMRQPWVNTLNGYAAMMLVWLLVLSIVPAVYCYQIAYRFEREQQVRQAHLNLFQQGRLSLTDAHYPWLQKQYLQFFFYTAPSATDSVRRQLGPGERVLHNLLVALEPVADSVHHSQLVTGDRPLDWKADKRPYQRARLQSHRPGAAAQDAMPVQYLVSQVNDVQLGRFWYWPNDMLRYVHAHQSYKLPAEIMLWLWRNVWLLVLLAGLYAVLRMLVRRVFGLDTQPLVALLRPGQPSRGAVAALLAPAARSQPVTHYYVVCPMPGNEAEFPPFTDDSNAIDCRFMPSALPPPGRETDWPELAKAIGSDKPAIVLLQFDYLFADAALTELKLALLLRLQKSKKQLFIVSRVHPAMFGDCGHARDNCDEQAQHQAIWQAGDKLLRLLSQFELLYIPVRHGALPVLEEQRRLRRQVQLRFARLLRRQLPGPVPIHAKVYRARRALFVHLRGLLYAECDALSCLKGIEEDMEQMLLNLYPTTQRLSEDDVLLGIQRQAELRYRSLWESLLPAEHYLLYDLAQDGLVNTRDTVVIGDLLQKGLLVYDTRLRVVNESFRLFIITGLSRQQALRLEHEASREAGSDESWQHRSLPLFVVLAVAAAFIFITQRGAINQTQAILAALTAALPLLSRLFSRNPLAGDVGKSAAK